MSNKSKFPKLSMRLRHRDTGGIREVADEKLRAKLLQDGEYFLVDENDVALPLDGEPGQPFGSEDPLE